jgi:hypothetical protein
LYARKAESEEDRFDRLLGQFIVTEDCPKCGTYLTRGHRAHLRQCRGPVTAAPAPAPTDSPTGRDDKKENMKHGVSGRGGDGVSPASTPKPPPLQLMAGGEEGQVGRMLQSSVVSLLETPAILIPQIHVPHKIAFPCGDDPCAKPPAGGRTEGDTATKHAEAESGPSTPKLLPAHRMAGGEEGQVGIGFGPWGPPAVPCSIGATISLLDSEDEEQQQLPGACIVREAAAGQEAEAEKQASGSCCVVGGSLSARSSSAARSFSDTASACWSNHSSMHTCRSQPSLSLTPRIVVVRFVIKCLSV